MIRPHPDNPATWKKYRNGLCEGCWAACCTMPVEARVSDLIRLGLADAHEIEEAPKKVAKRLIKSGTVASYRAATGIFTLARQASGDCIYLNQNRKCLVYDQRPDVCRHFPRVSSRPGYCPSFKILIFLLLISTTFFASCSDSFTSTLPDLTTFQENPSDQFLVDLETVDRTSPFVGSNNATPHDGAHVHYDNSSLYPSGSSASVYPAIYAVADGVINDVNSYKAVGSNYKYSIILAFASDAGNTVEFEYSIEPMINPGDESAYTSFILVAEGQAVTKGDIMAYIFVPEGGDGTHIHFNLRNQGYKQAPAIFSTTLHDAFTSKLSEAGSCIGVDLTADENPAGTGATDCL